MAISSLPVIQALLTSWLVLLAALLVRLLYLRLHHTVLLFVTSVGLNVVFGVAMLTIGLKSPHMADLALLEEAIDIVLTPFIALELFGSTAARESADARARTTLILALVTGAIAVAFASSSPDSESFDFARGFAFLCDTLVNISAFVFAARRFKALDSAPDRNLVWIRRFFLVEIGTTLVQSFIDPFLQGNPYTVLDTVTISLSVIVTAACLIGLRREVAKPSGSS